MRRRRVRNVYPASLFFVADEAVRAPCFASRVHQKRGISRPLSCAPIIEGRIAGLTETAISRILNVHLSNGGKGTC